MPNLQQQEHHQTRPLGTPVPEMRPPLLRYPPHRAKAPQIRPSKRVAMTTQEAINILSLEYSQSTYAPLCLYFQALKLAIAALQEKRQREEGQ